ncbi:hypothetical protein TrLO_g1630 [Triparma laevis f. longispina]|uniref:G patch domain-containing protein n=1 Tax=Triparma laevis f. longispina TaxID=1714387 RepID=A0A9W7E9D3_9STRA|nr:hypothetical protein TrLO_g1630 [Triparma laevis f. longispina]
MPPPKGKAGEVLDKQGRRRFHGAFTGGFSAGYYNTVGSETGWAPSQFKSSRDRNKDNSKDESCSKQRVEDFMDEEDGILGGSLKVDSHFGVEKIKGSNQVERVDNISEELISSLVSARIGKRLLQNLGASISKLKRTLNVPVPPPKSDLYGLGFNAFKNAPEFKAARDKRNNLTTSSNIYSMSSLKSGGSRLNDNREITLYDDSKKGTSGFSLLDGIDDVYDKGKGEYTNELVDYDSDVNDEPDFVSKGGGGFLNSLESFTETMAKIRKTNDGREVINGFEIIDVREDTLFQKRWPGPRVPLNFNEGHAFEVSEVGGGTIKNINPMTGKRESMNLNSRRAVLKGGKEAMAGVQFERIKGLMSDRFAAGSVESNLSLSNTMTEPPKKVNTRMTYTNEQWIPPPILCNRLGFKMRKEDRQKYEEERVEGMKKGGEVFFEQLGEIVTGGNKKGTEKLTTTERSNPGEKIVLKGESRPSVDLFKSIFEDGGEESNSSDEEEMRREEEGMNGKIEEKRGEEVGGGRGGEERPIVGAMRGPVEDGPVKLVFKPSSKRKNDLPPPVESDSDSDSSSDSSMKKKKKKKKKKEKKEKKKRKKEEKRRKKKLKS